MKKVHNLNKIGLLMFFVAFILMIICVIASKPVPDLIIWIFVIGLITNFVGCFISIKKVSFKNYYEANEHNSRYGKFQFD